MKGYGQFCPVAKGAEIFAERWTPLLLRELLAGTRTFNDLQRGVPLMSRSLLAKRLKELERAGVIERRYGLGPEYHLTAAGEALRPLIMELGVWGLRFARDHLDREDPDPRVLLWDMRRNINVDRLPAERVVVEFGFDDVPRPSLRRAWLVLQQEEVDVCYRDPGFPVDLHVATTYRTMVDVWLGDVPMAEALRREELIVTGPSGLARGFPEWLALAPFAAVERRFPAPVTE